jgi:hypothetical protein
MMDDQVESSFRWNITQCWEHLMATKTPAALLTTFDAIKCCLQ